MTIAKVNVEKDMDCLVQVIRTAFLTVAEDLNLTRENAPTNPAFINPEDILKSVSEKKIVFYGCLKDEHLIGCYALENAGEGIFYLERLAVLPSERHHGIGRELIFDAFERVRQQDGKKVSIAIIDENAVLKKWYQALGFTQTGLKAFPHLPFRVCFLEYVL